MAMPAQSEHTLAQGFLFGNRGVHSSRTIMVADLATVLGQCPPTATRADYRAAIVADNILGKKTVSTRIEAFQRLSALYQLDPSRLMFRGLRWYWEQGADSRPTIALLAAAARDPLLRTTAPVIQGMELGEQFVKSVVSAAIDAVEPGRFKLAILNKVAVNAGSSWTQAGFLAGRVVKHRVRPPLTAAAVAFALYLGALEGVSGDRLFATLWTVLLDHPRHLVEAAAQDAAARHLLDYRRAGSVRDISFRRLEGARGQS